MKRWMMLCLVLALGLSAIEPAFAARRVVVRRGPHRRTVVVVHRGWPIRRPLRAVVVRPGRVEVRVAPAAFLAPLVFAGVIVAAAPTRDILVWEDGETLAKDDD